ncbi:unnamed protein product, partial [Mesorhabditis belari]|uniref:Tudor domain-containing protein n=1 Tax=Mesorhabditis belari TaxID=2138241 RepID=A0AAF3ENS2_9BILA
MTQPREKKIGRWYFGGLASAGAACCTHPLDLLKVHLQTQQAGKITLGQMAVKLHKSDGLLAFYNGLSASLLRQLTYSTTRFAVYESLKKQYPSDKNLPFLQKALLAGVSGALGGLVGTPGDLVNVRMQNDVKLPPAERRNYKHALDGVLRIIREEGIARLFGGATMATSRAILMTIGQLAFYDQIKQTILASGLAQDNLATHFAASITAASIATLMTQPMDVLKTRMMNASPGQFKSIMDCFVFTAKLGPAGFFKGFVPAWSNTEKREGFELMAADVQKSLARRFGIPLAAVALGGGIALASIYYVKKGYRAVIVDRLSGVQEGDESVGEGFHLLVPFKQRAVVFDVQQTHKEFQLELKSKDNKEVSIVACIVFRLQVERLVFIYKNFGPNYEQQLLKFVQETFSKATRDFESLILADDTEGFTKKIFDKLKENMNKMDVVLEDLEMKNVFIEGSDAQEYAQKTQAQRQSESRLKELGSNSSASLNIVTAMKNPQDETLKEKRKLSNTIKLDHLENKMPGTNSINDNKENEKFQDVLKLDSNLALEDCPSSSTNQQKSPLEVILDSVEPFSWSEEMEKSTETEISNKSQHTGDRRDSQGTPDSSDGSVDSGRATGPPNFQNAYGEIVPQYEFEIHNGLVGLVIGVGGKTIKELSTRTGVVMEIKPHHEPGKHESHQICQVRGKREQINKCLCMLRNRFPAERFPELNLQPVLPGNPPLTDQPIQASWLTLPEYVPTEVVVVSMVDPGHIFLQQPTHPSFNSLTLLDRYMLQIYTQSTDTPTIPKENCSTGVLCAAPVLQAWFRALTVNYFEDTDEVLIRFVDYGGYLKVKREILRQIRTDLMSLPFQAVECYLANVQPVDGTWTWSTEAYQMLKEVTHGKVIEAHIVGYHVEDHVPFVELSIPDGNNPHPLRVDWMLMNMGLAKSADPSKMQRVPKTKSWVAQSSPSPKTTTNHH